MTYLIPRFEVGNEIWNPLYFTSLAQSEAARLVSSLDYNRGYNRKVFDDAGTVATAHAGRTYKMVMGVQGANVGTPTNRFTLDNDAIGRCHEIAIAPYYWVYFTNAPNSAAYTGWPEAVWNYLEVGGGSSSNFFGPNFFGLNFLGGLFGLVGGGGGGSQATAFEWFKNECITNSTTVSGGSLRTIDKNMTEVAAWVAHKNTYGKEALIMYEGGWSIVGPDSLDNGFPTVYSGTTLSVQNVRNFVIDYLLSQQHADLMTYYLQTLEVAGVTFPNQYCIAAPWANSNEWGMWRSNTFPATATLQYTAFAAYSQAPDPVLADDDFGTMEAATTVIKDPLANDVAANSIDSADITSPVSHGTATVSVSGGDQLSIAAGDQANVQLVGTYTVSGETANWTIFINAINVVAANRNSTTKRDVAVTSDLLSGATGTGLSVASLPLVEGGGNIGIVELVSGSTYRFTPYDNFVGDAIVAFTVTDGSDTSVGTWTITVKAARRLRMI